VLSSARKLWRRGLSFLPLEGFHFARPILVLQSDDWGRAGLRDQPGLDWLRSAGLDIRVDTGERPYDLFTLETAADLGELQTMLHRHRDSTGRAVCLGMNFVVANLDLAKMEDEDFRQIHLLPLADGLPQGWIRPGLQESYRAGIDDGVFHPALHGTTHFCRAAVERELAAENQRSALLRTLWRSGTPYIHWRIPWIGYEYWDPERPAEERFLPAAVQREIIGQAFGWFSKMFSRLPQSACAPGYRANGDTHRAWAQYGIRVAQNGPGMLTPPHFDQDGILNLHRNVEFEPATDPSLSVDDRIRSVDDRIRSVEACFERGIPAIISIHSINFHSSVSGFLDRTIPLLDRFLSALRKRHRDLLYLHDGDLHQLVEKGFYETTQGITRLNVTKKKFMKRGVDPAKSDHVK
jgi:hypothetical protein